jgi:amino acid permease
MCVLSVEILHMEKYKYINFVVVTLDCFSEGYSYALYSTNLLLDLFWIRNCLHRRKAL